MLVCLSGWKRSGKDTLADHLIKNYSAVRVGLADPLKDSVAEEFGIDRSSLDDPKRKESPLLDKPVEPKDAYSRMIAEFLIKELASADGKKPSLSIYENDCFLGVFNRAEISTPLVVTDYSAINLSPSVSAKAYWTPRALAILKGSTNRSVSSNFWTQKAFGVIKGELNENPDQMVVVTDIRYKSEVAQFKEEFGEKVVFIRIDRFKESPSQDPSERDLDDHKFDHYIENTGTLEEAYAKLEDVLKQFK